MSSAHLNINYDDFYSGGNGGGLKRSYTDTHLTSGFGAGNNGNNSFNAAGALAQLCPEDNPNNCTEADLASPLPLDKYRLNEDPCPIVVRKKPCDKVQYVQNINVRYLKPPEPPKSGDIVIRECPHRQIAPAPPLIVRQAPPRPITPPPVCIRECPPCPPAPLPGRCINVPGKVLPPPARKVIIERLPACPPKPQQIFIERWLPYEQPKQRVIYQPAKPICCIPDPKNVVIQWDAPDVEICRRVKNCGIHPTDPHDYVCKYGPTLYRPECLPEVAKKYGESAGIPLAATHRTSTLPRLEGQVNALSLVGDLDRVGLSHYRPILQNTQVHRANTFFDSPNNYHDPSLISNGTTASSIRQHHQQQQQHRFREPPQFSTQFVESEILTPAQAYINGPLCTSKSSNYLNQNNYCFQQQHQPTPLPNSTSFCASSYNLAQSHAPRSACRSSYTKTTSVLERSTSMVVKRYHC